MSSDLLTRNTKLSVPISNYLRYTTNPIVQGRLCSTDSAVPSKNNGSESIVERVDKLADSIMCVKQTS